MGGRALDGELIVEVSDSGAGLPLELVRHAFTRGWTTKTQPCTDAWPQGRGLGLALVEGTIRRLRGSIEVRRAPGALFEVRLPVPGRGRGPERTVEPTGETR